MKYSKFVSGIAGALCLILTSCTTAPEVPLPPSLPADFEAFCAHDWQMNKDIHCDLLAGSLHAEKRERVSYFSIMSRLRAEKKWRENRSISGDVRFQLLANAFNYMAWELSSVELPRLAQATHRLENAKLLAEFEKCRFLKANNAIQQIEEDNYQLFLAVSNANSGLNMEKVAERFDYDSIPLYDADNLPLLPKWIVWNEKTPLVWAKIMLRLPGEAVRTVGINKAKLLRCAENISRSIVCNMLKEYSAVLKREPIDLRAKAQIRYERHLAQAWSERFCAGSADDCEKEMLFLRDIYTLAE